MRSRAVAVGLLLVSGAGPVGAQSGIAHPDAHVRAAAQLSSRAADSVRGEWLVGGSVGVPGYGSEAAMELFTIGLHWTYLQPGRLGADFSFGTMPRVLAEGVLVLGFRGGATLPLTVAPGLFLLPSTGVSLIAGVSGGGGGGVAGWNFGVATAIFGQKAGGLRDGRSSTGLRAGITWHRFQDTRAAVWLLELGVVRAPGRSG